MDAIEPSLERSKGGRSRCFNIDEGDGERLWSNEGSVQSNWSKPRPTSAFSLAVGVGIQGGVGTGGSDIFGVFPLDRPLSEPMDRRALSFLPGPLPDFSLEGLCGSWLLDPDLKRPRKPFDGLRVAAVDGLPHLLSLMVRLRYELELLRPKVLWLSKRPSKSRRSSYSENTADEMLGRGSASCWLDIFPGVMVDAVAGGVCRADVDEEAEFGGEHSGAFALKPMPSNAMVGGFPSIQA